MKEKRSEWFDKNKKEIGLAVIFLVIGFVFGIGFNFYRGFSISFDNKINPTDLLTVFVTVILVWIITNKLDKEKQTERASKDIIQRRVQELYSLVDNLSEKPQGDNFYLIEATSSTKRINLSITIIEKLINKAEMPLPENLSNIKLLTGDINDLLTNSPVRDESDTSEREITVKNGLCYFNAARLAKIHSSFDSLKDEITNLELLINIS